MNSHREDALDLAWLANDGRLSELEHQQFRDHLNKGCTDCLNAKATVDRVSAELLLVPPTETPPTSAKEKLLKRVRTPEPSAPDWVANLEKELFVLFAADESGWEPTPVPGIEARKLWVDADKGETTLLVKLAPGASYPVHHHSGSEQCLVLAGDLSVGDVVLGQGDYQVAPAGSDHAVQSSENGCLLLLISSTEDLFA